MTKLADFVPVYMPEEAPEEKPSHWPSGEASDLAWMQFGIDCFQAREDAFQRWVAYERQQVKWLKEARDRRDAGEVARIDRELEETLGQIALKYGPVPDLIVIDPLVNHLQAEAAPAEPS